MKANIIFKKKEYKNTCDETTIFNEKITQQNSTSANAPTKTTFADESTFEKDYLSLATLRKLLHPNSVVADSKSSVSADSKQIGTTVERVDQVLTQITSYVTGSEKSFIETDYFKALSTSKTGRPRYENSLSELLMLSEQTSQSGAAVLRNALVQNIGNTKFTKQNIKIPGEFIDISISSMDDTFARHYNADPSHNKLNYKLTFNDKQFSVESYNPAYMVYDLEGVLFTAVTPPATFAAPNIKIFAPAICISIVTVPSI